MIRQANNQKTHNQDGTIEHSLNMLQYECMCVVGTVDTSSAGMQQCNTLQAQYRSNHG